MAIRKPLAILIKAGISSALVIILARSANVQETLRVVLGLPRLVFISAVLIYALAQVVSAYRWKLLSDAAGFCTPLRSHVSYYFIGMFFNLFLPTSIGGDGIKCWYLSRQDASGRKAPAIYTVLAERVTGFVMMLWTGTLALFIAPGSLFSPLTYGLAGAGMLLSVVFPPFIPRLAGTIFKQRTWAISFAEDISIYWHRKDAVLSAFAWSFVFHSLLVMIHIMLGNAMGLHIPAANYAVVYAASSLAGFIPISISGVGPREGAYVYLLTLVGVAPPQALGFAICWLGIIVAASLPGVWLYLRAGMQSREKSVK